MNSFLIDTQTLILAFATPEKLPKRARSVMEDGSSDRFLSAVSVVEIAIKSSLGKLQITEAELRLAINDLKLKLVPFSAANALRMFRLPQRTDVFDRMLVATALTMEIPIVGGDREFRDYKDLEVIWK